MKRLIVFGAVLGLILLLGYPLASELVQLESVQESKSQFEKTVLEDLPTKDGSGSSTNRAWNNLPEDLRRDLRETGFHPASPEDPRFDLPRLEGDRQSLEGYRGEWVVLNFWATWCPPCRMEMPSLDQLQETFREDSLRVVTINVQQSPSTIRQFKRNYGFELPVLIDGTGEVTKRYGATGLPETWVIDPAGRAVFKIDGALHWNEPSTVDLFERLLASADGQG